MLNPEDYVESRYCEYFFADCDCCGKQIEVSFEYDEAEGFYFYEELRDAYDKQVAYLGGDPEFLVCSYCFFELIDVQDINIDFPYIENILKEDGSVVIDYLSEDNREYNYQVLTNVIIPNSKKLLSTKSRADSNGGVF